MNQSNAKQKLFLAQEEGLKIFTKHIRSFSLHKTRPFLKFVFKNEVVLNIRYNNHGDYSYTVVFSLTPDDVLRFDNYDDIWKVRTKSRHFHTRGLGDVIKSPMIGDPENDIKLIRKYIFPY